MYWRIFIYLVHYKEDQWGFPGGTSGEEPTCQCKRHKTCRLDPWVRKIPWRRWWHPTPVFLPGESNGQRSLAGYNPWGHKESDTTKNTHTHTVVLKHFYRSFLLLNHEPLKVNVLCFIFMVNICICLYL